ncbi:hypothetical protein VMCG_06226 [Cytospora schulzeri]|uniref:MYND-type domain-containing protein n=1 Tax=Cytospora schulzeri TaxID=448051 RepID=A0A423W969_9PEZI|nr:hypothetical protein VMCG_06226 [Valsa malicola]
MSAMETDSDNANFGDGESENATPRGRNDQDAPSPTCCPICLKTTELSKCQGCDEMVYCSKACQRKDWPVHKFLCKKLPVFQATARPKNHFRAIFFPANDVGAGERLSGAEAPKPEFVWYMNDKCRHCSAHSSGGFGGFKYDQALMGHRQQVSTQKLEVLASFIIDDKPRNSCIEAVVGNRLLMRPWPLPGWRGNVVVVSRTGDVTMRDFRAIVDYFQCFHNNRGLVDPSRYVGQTFVGVLIVPEAQIGNPSVEPKVQEIHLTEDMKSYKLEHRADFFDGLLPIYVLSFFEKNTWLGVQSGEQIDYNRGSFLLTVSSAIDLLGKVILPAEPLPMGALIYLRKDGKPLLKHHYEALSEFVFRQAAQAAGAKGLSEREMAIRGECEATREDLEKLLTKNKFRQFWNAYCKSKRLEATPCPLDV